jgi:hypothetical protein
MVQQQVSVRLGPRILGIELVGVVEAVDGDGPKR